MNKATIFSEMVEVTYELSRQIALYESIPRRYGTDDELYMVEAHTINLVGDKVQTNITELSLKTNKTKGAISQMIDRLVKKEMVTKTKNPLDNREVVIKLTDKGNIVYDFHKEFDKGKQREILNVLDDFEVEDFKKYAKLSVLMLNQMKEDTERK